MLTIAYFTNRLEPKIEWFFDSLGNQAKGERLRVVVVDYHAGNPDRRAQVDALAKDRFDLVHVEPKPTVWQGKHRLTTRDYFAASNARNTAICLAPDGHIALVDDLSCLQPGWLDRVKMHVSTAPGRITCGAYRKVLEMTVRHGEVVHYKNNPIGNDHRLSWVSPGHVRNCGGDWMYGCSLVAPVNAFLDCNGYDEDCDGMGYEDVVCGTMLAAHGWSFAYDPNMMTFESEELHHTSGNAFLRVNKGISPNDASHKMLDMLRKGRKTAPNYFGEGGIRALRQAVLSGEPFPVVQVPQHHWPDGQPLSEM